MSAQAVTQKAHPFFQIYNTVIDHYRLNPYELSLYTALVRHANRKTGLAFPGYSRLMALTGMARATVAKYLKTLEQKKLIKIVRRWKTTKKGNYQRRVNHYYILDPHRTAADEMNQADPPSQLPLVHDPNHAGSPDESPAVRTTDGNETNPNQTDLNHMELNQGIGMQHTSETNRPLVTGIQTNSAPKSSAALPVSSGERKDWGVFCHRLADVCRLDFNANAGKIRKFACKLWRHGEGYSLADLDTFEQWWHTQDWRGQRGETPRLNDVCEGIREAVFETQFKEDIARASRYAYIEGELAAFIEH
jgi:DNA-binding MarR family transcriptional regulator